MSLDHLVNHQLVPIALEKVNYRDFEAFSNAFYGAIVGANFIPLGGVHDGGADGCISEQTGSIETFSQSSKSADPTPKIRQTVRRIREVGRDPKTLIYLTSVKVSYLESLENSLSTELSVRVVIRDATYFEAHINRNDGTRAAFISYLQPSVEYLRKFGAATAVDPQKFGDAKTLCVFLGQELRRQQNRDDLLPVVTDSLIYWALEGTDPEKEIFMSYEAILSKILDILPTAKRFIKGNLQARLDFLSSKETNDSKRIRFYKARKHYCLPIAVRSAIEAENLEEELLRLDLEKGLTERTLLSLPPSVAAANIQLANRTVSVCKNALNLAFQQQGLQLASYFQDDSFDISPSLVNKTVAEAVSMEQLTEAEVGIVSSTAVAVLRGAIFESSSIEREFFQRLSRTYFVFFSLQNCPEIVTYFREMKKKFILYVGSDILVRCAAESLLAEENRALSAALDRLKNSGCTLILSEPALEELWTHIKAADNEFSNHYRQDQQYMKAEFVGSIDRILIRAYFHARVSSGDLTNDPGGWAGFLNRFCRYEDLHKPSGKDSVRSYFVGRYGLSFLAREELEKGIDPNELRAVVDEIRKIPSSKKHKEDKLEILAENDALQALAIFSSRKERGELPKGSRFGYHSWWLTSSSKVRAAVGRVFGQSTEPFVMRVEFLMQFVDSLATRDDVLKSYSDTFPALLGVQLGKRLPSEELKSTLAHVKTVALFDQARAEVELAAFADKLQSLDFQ